MLGAAVNTIGQRAGQRAGPRGLLWGDERTSDPENLRRPRRIISVTACEKAKS